MKGESKSGYLMKAVLCGFLIAFNTVLFLNYFTDWQGIVGMIVIDIAFVFLIGYPFEESQPMPVIALTVFLLILGYAAYGPYATYLRGPMSQISESLSDMPEMAKKQMHCLMLIFTNPMAYQRECVLTEQKKLPEEKPEDFGLEITNFEIQPPEKEIYAGMPMQIWMTLENKGDYDAKNVEINTSGGKYEVCENLEVLNIKSINGNYSDKIRKETNHYFSLTGRINDPWDEKVNCTYAKNKMIIGGTIKTTYSYDYETESYLDMEVIKNVNETIPKFRVESAKEKAAPANILMYTFLPLIWKGAGEGFRECIIPISLKNERRKGTIVFRGKYEYKWFEGALESIKNEIRDWTPLGDYEYQYCVNKTNTSQELNKCEKEEEGKNITININNESSCVECGGEPIYRIRGKRDRNEIEYDKIIIKPVGDVGKYIRLSCNKKLSDEDKISSCICVNNICEIKYAGEKNDLKIEPGDKELLYTGLTLSLEKVPWPKKDLKFTFGIKSHATYMVEMEKSENLQIKNPHYTPD